MKTVKVTMLLYLKDDQPVEDWIRDAILEQLEEGEDILEYFDDEPITMERN